MTAASIAHDRAVERVRRISEALCACEEEVRDAVEYALDKLAAEGAFRVHRNWSTHSEREQIKTVAAMAVSKVVLCSSWCSVPHEIEFLHGQEHK